MTEYRKPEAVMNFARKILLTFAVFALYAPMSSVFAQMKPEYAGRESARFQEEETEGDEILHEADKIARQAALKYKNAQYQEAIDLYLKVNEKLRNLKEDRSFGERAADLDRRMKGCGEAISKCYYFWAEDLYFKALAASDSGDFETAIRNCTKAAEMWPPVKEKMEARIAEIRKLQRSVEAGKKFKDSVSVNLPEKQQIYSMDVLMRQGAAFYQDGMYDRARDKFEEVLAVDPYNVKAIESIRRCNSELLRAGTVRHELIRSEMLTEVDWKKLSPIKPRVFKEETGTSSRKNTTITKQIKEDPLIAKLKTIIVPKLDFEQISVSEIIDHLRRRSRDWDKSKEGVNIVYIRPSTSSAADDGGKGDEESDEGKANEGKAPAKKADGNKQQKAAADGEDEDNGQTLMVSFENQSLFKIIEDICKMAKLKFKVEKYAVVIADPSASFEELETRLYPIEQETVSKLSGQSSGKGDKGGGGGGAGGGAGGAIVGDTTARKYFESAGVAFGPGADVVYDSYCRRLIATNTLENLEKLEKILKNLDITDPQVLVQTKFVEVSMSDLEELGFQYSFSRLNSNLSSVPVSDLKSGTPSGAKVSDTVYNYYGTASDGYAGYLGSSKGVSNVPTGAAYYKEAPLQSSSTSFGALGEGLVRSASSLPEQAGATDGMFRYQAITQDGYKFSAMVNAVDQADSTDILACPKITTLNGYDASISMVTEQYFPDDWSEAELGTIAGTGGTSVPLFTPSIPDFGDAQRLGIELKVKPMVDMANGIPETIDIKMSPVINQFVDWTDYSYELQASVTGSNEPQVYTNILKKAIFEVRSIDTQVRCNDGQTMVLGGVVSDEVTAIDDQYPILGNLPLVGRLFQSKAKSAKKRNLLIFLTCRLIGPDGQPIREREMRGLPPFRQ